MERSGTRPPVGEVGRVSPLARLPCSKRGASSRHSLRDCLSRDDIAYSPAEAVME